jgi:hypothetical protein
MQREHRGKQQDAAVAILDVGGMNDGVQQQTQRVYENVALLALDFLARIIAMRIDAGPPYMGPLKSSANSWCFLFFVPLFFVPLVLVIGW